ncbi:unnamed protein product [Parajaminaea phylloscopi]
MADGGRQRIRPSLKELTQDDEELDWPPAATVSRGTQPPTLRAASKSSAGSSGSKKSVRIALPTAEDVRHYEPAPRERPPAKVLSRFAQRSSTIEDQETEAGDDYSLPGRRFELGFDGSEVDVVSADDPTSSSSSASLLPIVGGVQERPQRGQKSRSSVSTLSESQGVPNGSSRFKARRDAEKFSPSRGFRKDPHHRLDAPPTVSPASSRQAATVVPSVEMIGTASPTRDTNIIEASRRGEDEPQWLDENGKPMSAFRKARLQKLGQVAPAGVTSTASATKQSISVSVQEPDLAANESDLLKTISAENDKKIASMSSDEIKQDLDGLEAMFGKDLLQGLRERRRKPEQVAEPSQASSFETSPSAPVMDQSVERGDTPFAHASGKARNPDDPLNLIVFDLQGRVLPVPSHSPQPQCSHSGQSGQHGDVGQSPTIGPSVSEDGFSANALLFLAQSAVAGQRITALNVLNRAISMYGVQKSYGHVLDTSRIQLAVGQVPDPMIVATHLLRTGFYLTAACAATSLLRDRVLSVRHSALSTLRVAMLFGALADPTKQQADAEASETMSPCQKLMQTGLLDGFSKVLQGDELEVRSSRGLVVEILIHLVETDPARALDFVKHNIGHTLDIVVCSALKVTWPPKEDEALLTPLSRGCTLLLRLVESDRAAALALVNRGSLDTLLRYIAVPPWMISPRASEESRGQSLESAGFDILAEVLQIYTALSRYGFFASLVSRAWDLFFEIHIWAPQRTSQASLLNSAECDVIVHFYNLLATWTVCAIDPHQSTPEHEVTWTQVSEWDKLSLDLMTALLDDLPERQDQCQRLRILCALAEHLEVWLQGAAINDPASHGAQREQVQRLIATSGFYGFVLGRVTAMVDGEDYLITAPADDEEGDVEAGTSRGQSAADVAVSLRAASLTLSLISSDQQALREAGVKLATLYACRQADLVPGVKAAFVPFAVQSCVEGGLRSVTPAASSLTIARLLQSLGANDEASASLLISELLSRYAAETGRALHSLVPFYKEALDIRPNTSLENKRPLYAVPHRLQTSHLKRLQSQRGLACRPSEEGLDPVTQTILWTCPASTGLPLRPDWPLLPLDDLLRSAEASVFNRADNLPADWDPNEREVVKDALSFACWYMKNLGSLTLSTTPSQTARDSYSYPFSAHLLLAAQKVFMLESGIQGDLRKWTGAVTGKDLFRDPDIAPHLIELMDLGFHLSQTDRESRTGSRHSSGSIAPTLEALSASHFGPEVSYYSFYTDLVGLYDSISFGDALFARALLVPLSPAQYAPDYRRLLWKDYSHLLPTIRTPCRSVDLVALLLPDATRQCEPDDLIQAYVAALVEKRVQWEQASEEVLPRVAVHHIAAYLWPPSSEAQSDSSSFEDGSTSSVSQKSRASLAKALLAPREDSAIPRGLQDMLMRYDVQASIGANTGHTVSHAVPYVDDAELQRREQWYRAL